jgi:hypothetical protein
MSLRLAFEVQPTLSDAADNAAPNEAEYLDDYPLNEDLQLLHETIAFQLCDDQKWALSGLHGGIDILLVAKS